MSDFTLLKAKKYRELINKVAKNLEDSEAAYVPMIFERWIEKTEYEVGRRVCHKNKLYKVLITHISQASWAPDITPSLFAEILIPDPSIISEWVQPSSTNPYMTGDKVRHNGKIWISIADYNIWEPGVYGWEEIGE